MKIGGKEVVVMAGPCSVESREQMFDCRSSRKGGSRAARRGIQAAKFALLFSGHRRRGAQAAARSRRQVQPAGDQRSHGDFADRKSMLPYVDILQVGARNMQNFNLLRELGKVRRSRCC